MLAYQLSMYVHVETLIAGSLVCFNPNEFLTLKLQKYFFKKWQQEQMTNKHIHSFIHTPTFF